jgi:formylglycine-generating enzyme required for sulfatase activity
MVQEQVAERLRAFERHHGSEVVALACHAAMPVMLNPQVLHLIRINYFIDPPHALPYAAEASLLLSSLCTEVDDALYVMQPELRDLLLTRLIEEFGGARATDVARLLWEYCQRGAPWSDRPGLREAQQLTALNFIDSNKALNWLARARRGEGAAPVDDDRWFIALDSDLRSRAAVVDAAKGSGVFFAGNLPALTELHDALTKLFADPRDPLRIAAQLTLDLPGVSEHMGASRLWRAVLDAAWVGHRMVELIQAVSVESRDPSLTRAISEYWFRLSPALHVDQGHFAPPPAEWQILEQQRGSLEAAIRAVVLVCIDRGRQGLRFVGMGTLVGAHVVATHNSLLRGVATNGTIRTGIRIFIELATEHTVSDSYDLLPRATQRFEVTSSMSVGSELALLFLNPESDHNGLPAPLRISTDVAAISPGRRVCIIGSPTRDARIPALVLGRVFGAAYGVTRLQPGEILEEDSSKGILTHNCFTANGNGGSPVIDLQSGEVMGVHFAGLFEPNLRGLKKGHAVALARLADDPALQSSGALANESVTQASGQAAPLPPAQPSEIFIGRATEQQLFREMMQQGGSQFMVVSGEPGVGKTALLLRFQRLADEAGVQTLYLSNSSPSLVKSISEGLTAEFRADFSPTSKRLWRPSRLVFNADRREKNRLVVFIDDVVGAIDEQLDALAVIRDINVALLAVVLAGRRPVGTLLSLPPNIREISLKPLTGADLTAWFSAVLPDKAAILETVIGSMTGGLPGSLLTAVLTTIGAIFTDKPGRNPAAVRAVTGSIRTVEILRGSDEAIVYHDDHREKHGPYVLTRGTHTITVPERYRIGTYPVTNSTFVEFIKDGGYRHREFWQDCPIDRKEQFRAMDGTFGPSTWMSESSYPDEAECPVTGISYFEALAFVGWLDRTVTPPADMRWCLPSENMWEFAARGRSGHIYPWGSIFEKGRCNSREEGIGKPSPVGRFHSGKSPFDVEEMAGNVWEFVRATDAERKCVLRGGSFTNFRHEVKATLRLIRVPRSLRAFDFGMRYALEPGPSGRSDAAELH